jgi:hypothetical protein
LLSICGARVGSLGGLPHYIYQWQSISWSPCLDSWSPCLDSWSPCLEQKAKRNHKCARKGPCFDCVIVDSPGLQSVGMVGTCVSLQCLDTFRVHHLTLCGQEAEWCLRADPSHFVVISRTISSGPTPRHTGTPYYQCTTRWLLFFLLLVGCCSIPTMPPARIPRWTKDH